TAAADIAGKPVRACQGDPVLMAVQFPDDLVNAGRGVEEVDAPPEGPRHSSLVNRIQVPVQFAALLGVLGRLVRGPVRRESETAIAKEVVFTVEDASGLRCSFRHGVRTFPEDLSNDARLVRWRDQESLRLAADEG